MATQTTQTTYKTYRNSVEASSITFKGDNLKDKVYHLLLLDNRWSFTTGEIQSMLATIEMSGSGCGTKMTMIMPNEENVKFILYELMTDGLINCIQLAYGEEWRRYQAYTPFEIAQRKLLTKPQRMI